MYRRDGACRVAVTRLRGLPFCLVHGYTFPARPFQHFQQGRSVRKLLTSQSFANEVFER